MIRMIVLSLFLFAYVPGSGQSAKTETLLIKTRIDCDHCKQCESCGTRIHDAIWDLKGIKRVKISPSENTITVKYNPAKTDPEQIRKAIAQAGFQADDQPADPEGYAQLDDCCKQS